MRNLLDDLLGGTMMTPSQQAGQDILAGAHAAMDGGPVQKKKGFSSKGLLGGLSQGLSNIKSPDFLPTSPMGMDDQPVQRGNSSFGSEYDALAQMVANHEATPPFAGSPEWSAASKRAMERRYGVKLPGYADGGDLDEGDVGMVGDRPSGDPRELIFAKPGGGVRIQPLGFWAQGQSQTPNSINSPEQYGIQQTEDAPAKFTDPTGRFNLPSLPVTDDIPGDYSNSARFANATDNQPVNAPDDQPVNAGKAPSLIRQQIAQANADLLAAQKVSHAGKKGFFYGMMQGLNNALNHQNNPIQTYDDLKRERKSREPLRRLGLLQNEVKFDTDLANAEQRRALQQAQIDNYAADNEFQKSEATRKGNEAAERNNRLNRAGWFKTHPFFDAENATAADVNALAKFGETPESMGTYDFSKRDTKKIGGVTFAYDPNKKKYVDTGLPKAPGEQTAEIEITDPGTGETIKLETTSAKKAQMLNSRVVAQMSAEAAAARQQSQQTFQAGENEKNRQFKGNLAAAQAQFKVAMKQYGEAGAKQKATQGFITAYTKQNGSPPSKAQIADYINALSLDMSDDEE